MPSTSARAAVAALIAALALVPASAGARSGPSASTFLEKVDGFLQGYPGDCPPAEAPQDPTVCHEVVLTAWHVGTTENPAGVPASKNPWVLVVTRHTLTFPGGGADPTESDVVNGLTTAATVTFDRVHLSSAHVVATDVAMEDGTTMDVDATWDATSPRMQWGNDGPALGEFGRVHHLHGPCVNLVSQAHQKFRLAHVHALLNGVPSDDLSIFAFLAYNHFVTIEVHPASCG